MWRNEIRTCDCGDGFAPKREKQRHCSARCRDVAKKRLKRSGDKTTDPIPVARSGDTPTTNHPQGLGNGPTMVWTERDDKSWPTPTALQGDDYRLEYYEDGYPKLPACLNRRPLVCAEAA
jgi:hypothetical protein